MGISSVVEFAQEPIFSGFKNHLIRQRLSDKTVKDYMNYHARLIVKFQDEPFNQDTVNAFLDKWNCIPSRAYLKQLLSFLKNKDLEIPKLTGRKPRKLPHIISDDEKEKIAEYMYKWELRFGIMFELTLECGLRMNELLNITAFDYDWETWVADKDRPCRLKIKGKGGKERKVVISGNLMKAIHEYIKTVEQEEGMNFFKLKKSRWNTIWRKSCMESIGKTYKLHEIRHTTATDWYKGGKDLINIKNRLGHASVSSTQLYINPDAEDEVKAWEEEIA